MDCAPCGAGTSSPSPRSWSAAWPQRDAASSRPHRSPSPSPRRPRPRPRPRLPHADPDGTPTPTPTGTASATKPLPGTNCQLFPADNAWHADISKLPVSSHSSAWLTSTGANSGRLLHPDFGPSGDPAHPWYGIPYTVASGTHSKLALDFYYPDESDRVGYPVGSDTKIEWGSDRHALIVDKDACKLYEVYDLDYPASNGAGSGATWSLRDNALRPRGWTSADAAGLPILPGTTASGRSAGGQGRPRGSGDLQPHRHQLRVAGAPPGGLGQQREPPAHGRAVPAQGRLPAQRTSSRHPGVLTAFKKYGLIVADNGSDWYFGGTSEPGWDNALLDQLKQVPANAFQAVDASAQMISSDSGQSR